MTSLLIKSGRVVDPTQNIDGIRDILVRDGLVVEIGESLNPGKSDVFDATGLIVAPGFVDLHVHLREPGEYKETIESGGRAAPAGGFTSVCACKHAACERQRSCDELHH
jgi:dihydroorotase